MSRRITRQFVAQERANASINPFKKPVVCATKQKNKFSPGTCLICGLYMISLTKNHAISHGYCSPEDMIADGKVKFYGRYV